ncbi:MAG TPA: hypothetical protein VGZ00_04830 [Candidatus Baltobacteraceae bacterium]|jgi:high-affinity nickel-transport protein|nr:hypothetical protein [Candidatus Baltobacteraceae bacterium]
MLTGVLTVFVLGLRHGADPDHLAIIDNMTRTTYEGAPRSSRFVGTLFAGGHSVMVLSIAALVGLFGSHLGPYRDLVEAIGTWISLGILFLVAAVNLTQLRNSGGLEGSFRTRMVPKVLRERPHVLVAIPVGLLFGLGFETSSQLATYTIALSLGQSVLGALLVGLAFCAGIVCTDTLDSMLVHRFLSQRASTMLRAKRLWLIAVTVFALLVAFYQLAQIFGWKSPVSDLMVSAVLMGMLFVVYILIMCQTDDAQTESPHGA